MMAAGVGMFTSALNFKYLDIRHALAFCNSDPAVLDSSHLPGELPYSAMAMAAEAEVR
jgi:hypothetical protein